MTEGPRQHDSNAIEGAWVIDDGQRKQVEVEELQSSLLGQGYPNDPSVPDVYAEGVAVQIGYTSIGLVFNRVTNHPPRITPVAVVRMSLQQALVTTQILRKALKDYEKNVGPLQVPHALLAELEIDEEL